MSSSAPRLIVTGMYRTGSTRLYNLIREALVVRHPDARCEHFGAQEALEEALARPGPLLAKEHTFATSVADRIRSGDLQAIASIREPIATMVSLCSTFGWSVEQTVSETDRAMAALESVAGQARIFTYDTATDNSPVTVQRILMAAGLNVSHLEASRLAVRWSRRSVRRKSDAIAGDSAKTWDRQTLLHPGHVGAVRAVADDVRTALEQEATRLSMRSRVAALAAQAT